MSGIKNTRVRCAWCGVACTHQYTYATEEVNGKLYDFHVGKCQENFRAENPNKNSEGELRWNGEELPFV